mgnify:CR=1 FL=1
MSFSKEKAQAYLRDRDEQFYKAQTSTSSAQNTNAGQNSTPRSDVDTFNQQAAQDYLRSRDPGFSAASPKNNQKQAENNTWWSRANSLVDTMQKKNGVNTQTMNVLNSLLKQYDSLDADHKNQYKSGYDALADFYASQQESKDAYEKYLDEYLRSQKIGASMDAIGNVDSLYVEDTSDYEGAYTKAKGKYDDLVKKYQQADSIAKAYEDGAAVDENGNFIYDSAAKKAISERDALYKQVAEAGRERDTAGLQWNLQNKTASHKQYYDMQGEDWFQEASETKNEGNRLQRYEALVAAGAPSQDNFIKEGRGRNWDYLTDAEKSTYNALLNHSGAQAADKFLDDIQVALDKRAYDLRSAETYKEFEEAGTAKRIGMNAASIVAGLYGSAAGGIADAFSMTEAAFKNGDFNPYTNAHAAQQYRNDVRGATSNAIVKAIGDESAEIEEVKAGIRNLEIMRDAAYQTISGQEQAAEYDRRITEMKAQLEQMRQDENTVNGEKSKFLEAAGKLATNSYQAVMSGLDSAAGAAILGAKGYGVVMGLGAASERARELYESGATKGQIAMGAIGSGIIEGLFEEVSLDKFAENFLASDPKGIKDWVLKTLTQAGIEASEEVNTELANMVLDAINRGYASDNSQRIMELMKDGMSYTEAQNKAASEAAMNVFWAAYGGFVSGGAMGGVGGLKALAGSFMRQNTAQQNVAGDIPSAQQDASAINETIAHAMEVYQQNGSVSGNQADRVIADPEALKAIGMTQEEISGMTASQARAAVKEKLSEFIPQQITQKETQQAEAAEAKNAAVRSIAYQYGQLGYSEEQMKSDSRLFELSDAEKSTAYTEGREALRDLAKSQYETAGMLGGRISDIGKNYAAALTLEERTEAYKAGIRKAANNTANTEAVRAANVGFRNDSSRTLSEKDTKLLDNVSRRMGTGIVIRDDMEGWENGRYNKSTGMIEISSKAANPVMVAIGHEMTHRMQQLAPKQYESYRDAVAKYYTERFSGVMDYTLSDRLEDLVNAYHNAGDDISRAEALDELTAEYTQDMLRDTNTFQQIVNADRNLAKTIIDTIHSIIERIKSALGYTSDEYRYYRDIEKAYRRMYEESEKNAKTAAEISATIAPARAQTESTYTKENGKAVPTDPPGEVQHSIKMDAEYMTKAIAKNNNAKAVDPRIMEQAMKDRSDIAATMRRLQADKKVGLPEDVTGNTFFSDSSYGGSEENTTICPRTLASESFMDAVSEYIGRPLTVAEQLYISQDLQNRTTTPECLYCYVATDRKAYREFLGSYISQRDSVIEKLKSGSTDTSRSGELYQNFLNGRKDTDNMWKRFSMWVKDYQSGKKMITANHLTNMAKLMGDIKSEFGAEYKDQIKDAMAYAQSASWAKKRVGYLAYNNHILGWKQARIDKLNSHYGLRMYSFSDFHPAFILENMQMITDASVRGLKMLAYTKDTDFVKIFAGSGININVSCFGFESGGKVFENNIIGANWNEAKALRAEHPNVGVTFVATNDTLTEWAMAQDWIDVVIPYHLVRTGAEVAEALGYKNYTSESGDKKAPGWSKDTDSRSIAPTEHNNDFQTYMDALAKNHLTPRFERFIDNPNYMKLVNECRQSALESSPVQPVFDMEAAKESLAKLEANGYYTPIGGSVDAMYEHAGEIGEDILAGKVQHSVSGIEEIASTESVDIDKEKGDNRGTIIAGGDSNDNRGVRGSTPKSTGFVGTYRGEDSSNVGNAQKSIGWGNLPRRFRNKAVNAVSEYISKSRNYSELRLYISNEVGNLDGTYTLAEKNAVIEKITERFYNDCLVSPDYAMQKWGILGGNIIDLYDSVMNAANESLRKSASNNESLRKTASNNESLRKTASNYEVNRNKNSKGRQLSKGQAEYFKKSKARASDGRLIVFYHGSSSVGDIDVFDPNIKPVNGRIYGDGIYFTENLRAANSWSESGNIYEAYLNIERPFVVSTSEVVPENLKRILETKYSVSERFLGNTDSAFNQLIVTTGSSNATDILKSLGYDGVLVTNENSNSIYTFHEVVVFDSNQIKRTSNLNPTNDKNINRSIKGIEDIASTDINPTQITDIAVLKKVADGVTNTELSVPERNSMKIFQKQLSKIEDIQQKMDTIRSKPTISPAERSQLQVYDARLSNLNKQLWNIAHVDLLTNVTQRAKTELIEKYGSIDVGEKPSRAVSIPKQTNKDNRVSQTVRTFAEAAATTDEMAAEIEKRAIEGEFSYLPITDEASKARAETTIKRKGWDDALSDWSRDIGKTRFPGKDLITQGFMLYNNAVNQGDTRTAVRILSDITTTVRNSAQVVQAVRVLKQLSPENRLYAIQRQLDVLQDDLNERYGDKAPQIDMASQLVQDYLNATGEENIRAAEKALFQDIANKLPNTFVNKWNAWRYLSMLGNLRTHVRNVVGNVGFVPVRALKDTVAAITEEAWQAAHPGERRDKALLTLSAEDKALRNIGKADFKTAADLFETENMKSGDSISKIERLRPAFGADKAVWRWLSKAAEMNSDLLGWEDTVFKKSTYSSAFAQYMKANSVTAAMIENGEVSPEFMDSARTYAMQEALKATYNDMNQFSDFVASIGNIKNSKNKVARAAGVIVEGVLPFKRTPANILLRAVEYSPVGLVNGIAEMTYGVKHGKVDAAQAIDALAEGLTGSALLGLGALLMSMGLIKPGDDDDDKQKKFDTLRGEQSYALVIGDHSYTIDWLAPEVIPMFVGAEIYNAFTKPNGEKAQIKDILEAFSRISNPLLEMSMLSGLNDMLDNISYSDKKLYSIVTSAISSYLLQGLPTVFGQIERIGETERETTYTNPNSQFSKDTQYTIAKAANKIPGIEYNQIPYIDAYGRRQSTGNVGTRVFSNVVSPGYIGTDRSAPWDDELQRLYDAGNTSVYPSMPSDTSIDDHVLTAEELIAYREIAGKAKYDLLNDLMNSDVYETMSDADKASAIDTLYKFANAYAKSQVVEGHAMSSAHNKIKSYLDNGYSYADYIFINEGVKGPSGRQTKEATVNFILQNFPKSEQKEAYRFIAVEGEGYKFAGTPWE